MRIHTIAAILTVLLSVFQLSTAEHKIAALQHLIVHIPSPVGARGKPFPIMAGIKSIKVSLKSSKDVNHAKKGMFPIRRKSDVRFVARR
jgi:hypothetical protein